MPPCYSATAYLEGWLAWRAETVGSVDFSDGGDLGSSAPYARLSEGDYFTHQVVAHGRKEWVRGDVHTNGIEGFWSQMKRSIDGTHHHVSGKHLQKYADEYSFRYNRRHSERPMFRHLTSQLVEERAA